MFIDCTFKQNINYIILLAKHYIFLEALAMAGCITFLSIQVEINRFSLSDLGWR